MKRIVLFVLIFSLMSGFVFARRGVDPSFIPIDKESEITSSDEIADRVWKDPYLGMEFVYVPGGCYEMGCSSWTDRCDDDEYPVHTVCVDEFWIGRYEVTFEQYDRFCEETGRSKPDDGGWGRGTRPVINVSWYDAKAFAKWLSKKTGYKFRLPTEAEWEYACRGGGKKVKYGTSTGGLSHDLANYLGTGGRDRWKYTSPVGSFPPNPLGLYDMSGNVWEWCEDVYSSNAYEHHSRLNPIYTSGGSYHVGRGGGWNSDSTLVRCANRNFGSSSSGSFSVGFRLLLKK